MLLFLSARKACVYRVTHVPRTSLKSKIFLMSSTCFFQDPSLDSPFSFAISRRGGGRRRRRERDREKERKRLPEDHQSSHPTQEKKRKEK